MSDYDLAIVNGDLTPLMLEVEVDSTDDIEQSCACRLDCPRGQLPDDKDYGMSLASLLSRGLTKVQLATLPERVKSELRKDDRIATVACKLIEVSPGVWRVDISGSTALGPFIYTRTLP